MSKPTVIVILGMHRSGTSVLCELISHLGGKLVDGLIPVIDAINSHGFFEDAEVVRINELLLMGLNRTWFDLRPLPSDWLSKVSPDIFSCAKRHVDEHYLSQDTSLLKDPRLCLLMPFWSKVFEQSGVEVKLVYGYRNPGQVAASLNARDAIPIDSGFILWLNYTLGSFSSISHEQTFFAVNYADLLSDSITETHRIANFLDINDEGIVGGSAFGTIIDSSQQRFKTNSLTSYSLPSMTQYLDITIENIETGINNEISTLADSWLSWHEENEEWIITVNEHLQKVVSINKDLHQLGEDFKHAQEIVALRDQQLKECNQQLMERDTTLLGRINRNLIYRKNVE
ncbi:MAG: post-segregation antitoxin (ccd killing protein) [Pseudomonadales bacterium]|jgi:post-segregation antitoxin (ccd killing protein)